MRKQKAFREIAFAIGILTFLALLPAAATASLSPPRLPMGPCDLNDDAAFISQATIPVGEEAALEIRVGSDTPIRGFQFLLQLPSHVTGMEQIRVESGCCPFDFGDPVLLSGKQLLISTAGIGDPVQINSDCVFLTVYISTHCWALDAYQENITWVLGDPELPSSYLVHTDCQKDPFNLADNGYIWFHNYVRWEISSTTGLYGDEVVLTVSCNNNIAFSQFNHSITYENQALQFVELIGSQRTQGGSVTTQDCGGTGCLNVQGSKGTGFGTDLDGLDFYQLKFRIITHEDNVDKQVCFAASPREMIALDCGQLIHQPPFPSSVSYNCGWVFIPPYRMEFTIGDAFWNGASVYPVTVEVPVYLKNNLEVTGFRISVKYNANQDNLRFLSFISEGGWELSGMDLSCGSYRYALLAHQGAVSIPASDESRVIGRLVFTRYTGPDPASVHLLEELDLGCGTMDQTFVSCLRSDYTPTYYAPDPHLVFDNGSLTIEPPTVWINVPGVNGTCDKWGQNCQYYASTSFNAKTNVDLTSLTFKIPWTPDNFCVNAHDLNAAHQVTVDINEDELYALVTVHNLSSSDGWKWYGCLRFNNATYAEQWGDLLVTDVVPVETNPTGVPLTITATAGGIHLHATPMSIVLCGEIGQPSNPDRKLAAVPLQFALVQNHPNPFNASTTIEFTVPEAAQTTLEVFNVMGRRVVVLLDAVTEAGAHSVTWNGRDTQGEPVASGIYFYRLMSGLQVETKKMVLMK